MLSEQDLIWLLANLPIELIQHIITGYNGHRQLGFDNMMTCSSFKELPDIPDNVVEFDCTGWETLVMLADGSMTILGYTK